MKGFYFLNNGGDSVANGKGQITCSACGKSKVMNEFYTTNSPFHKSTGRLSVCKKCIWDFVGDDLDKLKIALRMIDKPFLSDLLISSQKETERTNKKLISVYMKNLAMHQYREMTWDDSDFEGHKSSKKIEHNIEYGSDLDITEMRKKWGEFPEKDYEYLENFYSEYENNYATDTPVQINLYKSIAKVHLQAEKELAAGNIKTFKDLMELSSKLHNDGNIKPIQSSGANDDKGLSTYGLWIKTIEQEEPCEYFENKPVYEDYDKFKKYIDKWFIRPFKNIFNLSKDFDVKDDD